MEPQLIITIIQGGAVGLAFTLIWLIYHITKQHNEQVKMFGNHASEVIDRNSQAFIQVATSNQKLCDSHDRLCEIIKEKL